MMRKLLIYICLLGLNVSVFAQKDLDEQVNVVRPYKPVLAEAVKLSGNPEIAFTNIKPTELKYDTKINKYDSVSNLKPYDVEALKAEKIKKLYRFYTKLAFGNYLMPYAEVYVNNIRSKNNQYGVFAKHHSGTNDKLSGGFSNNAIELYGTKLLDKSNLGANIFFNRNKYDYKRLNRENDYNFNTLQQTVGLSLNTRSNARLEDTTLKYRAIGSAYYMEALNRNASAKTVSEANANIAGNVLGKFQNYPILLGVNLDLTQTTQNYGVVNNHTFEAQAAYVYKDSLTNILVGAKSISEYGDFNKFHLYPNINASYELMDNYLTVYGGITGGVNKNTMRKLLTINPYMSNNLLIINTNEKLKLFLGTRFSFNNSTGMRLQLTYTSLQNLAMFSRDTLLSLVNGDSRTFNLSYAKGGLFQPMVELMHQANEKVRLYLSGTYNSYSLKDNVQALHLPTLTAKASIDYNIGNKFLVKADLYHYAGAKAQNDLGAISTLKSYTDVGFGIDYRYSKTVSIFLDTHNLLGQRTQLYYGYNQYGFNILGGITVAL